jgi:hypothetical protein
MTSYDDLWVVFLNNVEVSNLDLPQNNNEIHDAIHNAVLHYNNVMETAIECNHVLEAFSTTLSDNQILILAHFLRLVLLKNKLTLFTLTWQPFEKEIGVKNFGTQLKMLESMVAEEKETISQLIINQQDSFM